MSTKQKHHHRISTKQHTFSSLRFFFYFHFIATLVTIQLNTMTTAATVVKTVSELASKPFIQRALANPNHPRSVLSFFFGVDYNDSDSSTTNYYKKELRDTTNILENMSDFWFKGYPEYDQLCQPFVDIVRKAGKKELQHDDDDKEEWNDTVDGLMAQIILCDQLSRNIFRGTDEAFAYDEPGLEIAKELVTFVMDKSKLTREIQGECYPSYYSFMTTPLMHSESLEIHEKAIEFIKFVKDTTPQLSGYMDYQLQFELDHKKVIERFGRYPHRNALYGRVNTPEETAWLEDTENLPGWAKSQMKNK